MAKSKLGKTAIGFFALAFLLILISFFTSSWLVNDGQPEQAKFKNLGLWSICLNNFEDPRHWYDYKFDGCHWIYEEELHIVRDVLRPGTFIAVQFFFTISFIFVCASVLFVLAYLYASKHDDDFLCLLSFIGGALMTTGICGTIACITFGMTGDARYWMPHWEHNNMGYSYWFACIGTVSSYIGSLCFLVESRKYKLKKNYLYNRDRY